MFLRTTVIAGLLAWCSLASAQAACRAPSEFLIQDSLPEPNFYKVSEPVNGTLQTVATTDEDCASTFWVNRVCNNPGLCQIPQLSYNSTDEDSGEVTIYGAYAYSAGGPLEFRVVNTSAASVPGYSVMQASLYSTNSSASCTTSLSLMGFLNKYLSLPSYCDDGLLHVNSYGRNYTGCVRVTLPVLAA